MATASRRLLLLPLLLLAAALACAGAQENGTAVEPQVTSATADNETKPTSALPDNASNTSSTESSTMTASSSSSESVANTTEAAATTKPEVQANVSEAAPDVSSGSQVDNSTQSSESSSTMPPSSTSVEPTTSTSAPDANVTSESPRNSSGRSMGFDSGEDNSTHVEKGSLQDLTLDDIDMSMWMTTAEPANASSEVPGSSPTPAVRGMCVEGNATYVQGERFNRSCDETCVCAEGGEADCEPRCSGPMFRVGSRKLEPMCFEQPTQDSCCSVLVCAHDTETEPSEECVYKNETYKRGEVVKDDCESVCTCAEGGVVACKPRCAPVANNTSDRCVSLPDPADPCCTVVRCDVTLADHEVPEPDEGKAKAKSCAYKGQNYSVGEEFHDGCQALCQCVEKGGGEGLGVECADIECPTDFGLDLLDPHCLEWELQPSDFVAQPPHCCPEEVRCRSNGSCEYAGERFPNLAALPARVTGCEKRCFCDAGNVTCQPNCAPVPAAPPPHLPCEPRHALLAPLPGDDCCMHWTCQQQDGATAGDDQQHGAPDFAVTSISTRPQLHYVSSQPEEIVVQTLEAVDSTSVRLVFTVPHVFVGLHGRIELRYTEDKTEEDMSKWKLQVLAPPGDLLATPTLEFTLEDLLPDTEYRVRISALLRDLHNSPSSPVLTVRTLPASSASPSSTLPPVVTISPNLSAPEVNTTWAVVSWRRFSDFELELIDGVQLRYKQIDDKVYAATPLIHRAVTMHTLEGLRPATRYEVGIFFIPFHGQSSELQANAPIQFTTAEAQDLYSFDVHVEVHHIKVTSVEVNWTGVPYPEDKYVNIYRAIYQSEAGKEDFSTFTVAKRDSASSTLIKDLLPGTRYRLWLEVYLTNGKIKKSNVQDFSTKPGSVPVADSSLQGKLERTVSPIREAGDYYSPLVAVAILAALAILATLILLLMLMRRRSQTKAAISAGRKSQSAYDNPSYKTCEDQPAANGNGSAKTTSPEPA